MKVLVTGGTGVVGSVAVDHLRAAGHTVRLLSRNAERDAKQWDEGVEAWPADVASREAVHGAADGCGAVLHAAGIVAEHPPEATYARVNVEGTRNLVAEAARAGVKRFVYVSSLGAERGKSEYHRSKHAAEEVVRAEFPGNWLVVRPGNVYGPGDEMISLLLKMVRTLPAIPLIGWGSQPFQPVWADDLGQALARSVEETAPSRTTLELAGTETTTMADLLERMEKITGRHPVHIPVPELLARMGAGAAEALGVDLPLKRGQIIMLAEGNVLPEGEPNALVTVFGVKPTPLDEGLRELADTLPERLPSEGVGGLERRRYWADLRGSRLSADELFEMVRRDFYSLPPEGLMEVGAEPGATAGLDLGETLTLSLPLRGNIQVRCVEVRGRVATCVTLEGHPLSGVIRFIVEEPRPGTLRFEVRSYTRSSGRMDHVGMSTVGKVAQRATWHAVVEEVVKRSGGEAPEGVQEEHETLSADAAREVEVWVEELVMRYRREDGK
jgi:NADH dehydrogenase